MSKTIVCMDIQNKIGLNPGIDTWKANHFLKIFIKLHNYWNTYYKAVIVKILK